MYRVRSDAQDPHTAGDSFFAKAKTLLQAELDNPKMTSVQALALMAEREAFMGGSVMGGLYIVMLARIIPRARKVLNPKCAGVDD